MVKLQTFLNHIEANSQFQMLIPIVSQLTAVAGIGRMLWVIDV
jgi:hypothetical protein